MRERMVWGISESALINKVSEHQRSIKHDQTSTEREADFRCDEWVDGLMGGWVNGWVGGWVDGWVNGWVDERMGG